MIIKDVNSDTVNGIGIVKVLICGLSSQTVIRSIGLKTTCGELKRQLGVSLLMSCGQTMNNTTLSLATTLYMCWEGYEAGWR